MKHRALVLSMFIVIFLFPSYVKTVEQTGVLTVNVVDRNDNPISDAFVSVNPQGYAVFKQGYTDSSGEVSFSDLADLPEPTDSQTYHIHVQKSGYWEIETTTTNVPEVHTTANIVLRRLGSLVVVVKDNKNNPIRTALVSISAYLYRDSYLRASEFTDNEGIATFSSIAEGYYDVEVTKGGYYDLTTDVTVNEGLVTTETITLVSPPVDYSPSLLVTGIMVILVLSVVSFLLYKRRARKSVRNK